MQFWKIATSMLIRWSRDSSNSQCTLGYRSWNLGLFVDLTRDTSWAGIIVACSPAIKGPIPATSTLFNISIESKKTNQNLLSDSKITLTQSQFYRSKILTCSHTASQSPISSPSLPKIFWSLLKRTLPVCYCWRAGSLCPVPMGWAFPRRVTYLPSTSRGCQFSGSKSPSIGTNVTQSAWRRLGGYSVPEEMKSSSTIHSDRKNSE